MTIAEFNRRILIKKYAFAQDSSGGNIKGLLSSFNIWAKVEPQSVNRSLEQLQITYSEAYKITTRFEDSRALSSNDEIIYEDAVLNIHGIRQDSEGKKKFNVITAYSTGSTVSAVITTTSAMKIVIGSGTDTAEYKYKPAGNILQDDAWKSVEIIGIERQGIMIYTFPVGSADVVHNSTTGELDFTLVGQNNTGDKLIVWYK